MYSELTVAKYLEAERGDGARVSRHYLRRLTSNAVNVVLTRHVGGERGFSEILGGLTRFSLGPLGKN